jgi:phage FluMu gp28-like protein
MFGQEVFDQEFECKFLAAPGQVISRELIESALAGDCVPFLPYRPEDDVL